MICVGSDTGAGSRASIASSDPRPPLAVVGVALLYGIFLWWFNPRVTVFDDEAGIVASAGQALAQTLGLFLRGEGQHLHPPLYDVVLHGWMWLTGAERSLLRPLSILFTCISVCLVGATAEMLWRRGLVAALVTVAWPNGVYFGHPAHWLPLTTLLIAATTWAYVWMRASEGAGSAIVFAVMGLALVYTNYLGIAFLGVLGLHALLDRPSASLVRRVAAAGAAIAIGFLALLPAFLHALGSAPRLDFVWWKVLANGGYLAYSLTASEAVAPWHWPAAIVACGLLLLGFAALRTPRLYWLLSLLAAVYAAAALTRVIDGKKVGVFGPWLLLYLGGLVSTTRYRRTAVAGLALAFGTGWLGILTGLWPATFRYVEPWERIATTTLREARPGDLIVCNHPSFYFYVRYERGWQPWVQGVPEGVVEDSGLSFATLSVAEPILSRFERVIYVRTVVNRELLELQEAIDSQLAEGFELRSAQRFLEDPHAELKNRFVGNQPRWRIELFTYERRSVGSRPRRTSGDCPSDARPDRSCPEFREAQRAASAAAQG